MFSLSVKNKSCRVYGYTIRRISAGKMLEATAALQDIAAETTKHLMQGDGDIVLQLTQGDIASVIGLAFKAGARAREPLFMWLSDVSGIPRDTLENDPRFGMEGLAKVLLAVWKVNDMDSFFAGALPELSRAWQGIISGSSGTAANTNPS